MLGSSYDNHHLQNTPNSGAVITIITIDQSHVYQLTERSCHQIPFWKEANSIIRSIIFLFGQIVHCLVNLSICYVTIDLFYC